MDTRAAGSELNEPEAALRKEAARLARRVGQLETTLREVELLRDANTGLIERIMAELEVERARSRDLLLNILPQSIIDRLNGGERLIADRFDDIAVVFSDFVGFTEISARLPVATVVSSLNEMFSGFDSACAALGVEKIKTIGDAYLAAAGLPRSDSESDSGSTAGHIHAAADLALTMLSIVDAAGPPWRIRVGIHNGPVVAGVIGTNKFVYDLWGDAVNVASRMESQGTTGRIQITNATKDMLGDEFEFERRGTIAVKGKGDMEVWYLVGRRPPDSDAERPLSDRSVEPVPNASQVSASPASSP
jgi:class 3 adenylate cyclase